MRKQLLASTAALALMMSGGVAQATLTYTIWNGGGLSLNAAFPVPTTNLFATFTSTVDNLNFNNPSPQGSPNPFSAFFGAYPMTPALTAAQLATNMSTTGNGITTFIEITESYTLAAALTSNLTHDDGAQVFLDGSTTTALCGAAGPGLPSTQSCTFPAGSHTLALLYTEVNGSPAELIVNLPPEAVPEPASLALVGTALAGLGVAMRRRRKKG